MSPATALVTGVGMVLLAAASSAEIFPSTYRYLVTEAEAVNQRLTHVLVGEIGEGIMSGVAGHGTATPARASTEFLRIMRANAHLHRDGGAGLREMFGDGGFRFGVNGGTGAGQGMAAWGQGTFKALGDGGSALDWEGNLYHGNLGVAYRPRAGLMIGIGVGVVDGNFDYAGHTGTNIRRAGVLDFKADVTYPYATTDVPGGQAWAFAGLGQGEIKFADQAADSVHRPVVADHDMRLIGLGLHRWLDERRGLQLAVSYLGTWIDIRESRLVQDLSHSRAEVGIKYRPPGMDSLNMHVALRQSWGTDGGFGYTAGGNYERRTQDGHVAFALGGRYVRDGDALAGWGGDALLAGHSPLGPLGLYWTLNFAHGLAGASPGGASQLGAPATHETGTRARGYLGYGLAFNGGMLTPSVGFEQVGELATTTYSLQYVAGNRLKANLEFIEHDGRPDEYVIDLNYEVSHT